MLLLTTIFTQFIRFKDIQIALHKCIQAKVNLNFLQVYCKTNRDYYTWKHFKPASWPYVLIVASLIALSTH